jgi:hypothetical protein
MSKRQQEKISHEPRPKRPETDEQSGSTGRDVGPATNNPGVDGKPGTGANAGQGNYGQSGYGQGGYAKGGGGVRPQFQKDVSGRDAARPGSSNRGSGNREPDVDGERDTPHPVDGDRKR